MLPATTLGFDRYFFEQRVLKFIYSIVDERSTQIANEVYNGGVCMRFRGIILSVLSVCCVDVPSLLHCL